MKIEQVHVKHKTWHTRITVGEGKEAKTFGLQKLNGGRCRIHIPFGGNENKDFDSEQEALDFCQS
jgi:hypothetical protein